MKKLLATYNLETLSETHILNTAIQRIKRCFRGGTDKQIFLTARGLIGLGQEFLQKEADEAHTTKTDEYGNVWVGNPNRSSSLIGYRTRPYFKVGLLLEVHDDNIPLQGNQKCIMAGHSGCSGYGSKLDVNKFDLGRITFSSLNDLAKYLSVKQKEGEENGKILSHLSEIITHKLTPDEIVGIFCYSDTPDDSLAVSAWLIYALRIQKIFHEKGTFIPIFRCSHTDMPIPEPIRYDTVNKEKILNLFQESTAYFIYNTLLHGYNNLTRIQEAIPNYTSRTELYLTISLVPEIKQAAELFDGSEEVANWLENELLAGIRRVNDRIKQCHTLADIHNIPQSDIHQSMIGTRHQSTTTKSIHNSSHEPRTSPLVSQNSTPLRHLSHHATLPAIRQLHTVAHHYRPMDTSLIGTKLTPSISTRWSHKLHRSLSNIPHPTTHLKNTPSASQHTHLFRYQRYTPSVLTNSKRCMPFIKQLIPTRMGALIGIGSIATATLATHGTTTHNS